MKERSEKKLQLKEDRIRRLVASDLGQAVGRCGCPCDGGAHFTTVCLCPTDG